VPRSLEPVKAVYVLASSRVLVTFNHRLVTGGLNAANWTCRLGNRVTTWSLAAADAYTVTLISPHVGGPDPGPNAVSFAPPPFDVVALKDGTQAPAFAYFPLSSV